MLTTLSMAESYVVARREPGPREALRTEERGGKSQKRWSEKEENLREEQGEHF